MTAKQFVSVKLVIVFLLALLVSVSLVRGDFVLPIIGLALAVVALNFLRSQVKEVLTDERDNDNAGKAARWAIQVYGLIAVVVMIVLHAQRNLNPNYEPIAMALAYSTCALLFIYALIFKYFHKIAPSGYRPWRLFLLIVLLALIFASISVRFLK